jgi:hypothetical protein
MRHTRARRVALGLLRYIAADLQAEDAAFFAVSKESPPFRLAQTEMADQALDNAAHWAWQYARATLARLLPVKVNGYAVWPLHSGTDLIGLLCLAGNAILPADDVSGPRRIRLEVLAGLIAEAPPVVSEGWPLAASRNGKALEIREALMACNGVVAHAARMLGRSQRTLWDQCKRFDIRPKTFRRVQ